MGTAYATRAQLYVHGAPSKAFGAIPTADQDAALEAASRVLDTYFRGRYPVLPLTSWDSSVIENVSKIAAYELLSGARGFNPAAGADSNILERYNQAIAWGVRVQKQQAHPDVQPLATQSNNYDQPRVISSSVSNLSTGSTSRNRGW